MMRLSHILAEYHIFFSKEKIHISCLVFPKMSRVFCAFTLEHMQVQMTQGRATTKKMNRTCTYFYSSYYIPCNFKYIITLHALKYQRQKLHGPSQKK